MIYKLIILFSLVVGFSLLFVWLARESIIRNVLKRTYDTMDAAARQRVQENRRLLGLLNGRRGLLYRIEQRLMYSGLVRKFPFLTPELWIVGNLAVTALVYFIILLLAKSFLAGLAGMAAVQLLRNMALSLLMGKNYRAVNDNLLKFLDFLGNYSITAGEATGIFNQISKYVEEPLKSVLDECYYEAQTSGDASLALLSMAEKIEHPKFKELVRNIEISARYSADFTLLVNNSRRAVREHLRTRQERKSLVREALLNMLILAGMSMVILASVEQLTEASIWSVLLNTAIGRICLGAILLIFGLLYGKIRHLDQ